MRQLREWLLLLRTVLMSLSPEAKETMEETMISWRERGRTGGSVNLDGTGSVATEGSVAAPPGPGEWEDALGLPLCVVCQNVSRHDLLDCTVVNFAPVDRKDRLLGEDSGVERGNVRPCASIPQNCFIEA